MSVPVIGIPVLNHPQLLAECVASIDYPVERLVVVDNSPDGEMGAVAAQHASPYVEDLFVGEPPANLGYGPSANLVYRTHLDAPWVGIANADVVFAPGDIERLDLALSVMTDRPALVGLGDLRLFGVTQPFLDAVGLFDENFAPAYCEDVDLLYRARLAGAHVEFLPTGTTHVGSVSYRSDPRYAPGNARTYPRNVAYYEAKWGGPMRGGERFTTPFDAGGPVWAWSVDVPRLRLQRW